MSELKPSLGIRDEIAYANSIASLDFTSMDSNIECPNCGAKMEIESDFPEEEYVDRGFKATDDYCCHVCGLVAIITQYYAQTYKEVEFNTFDMF